MVIFTPDYQRWGLVLAKVSLPLRVIGHIVLVIVEQGQLNSWISFTGKVTQVGIPVIWAYRLDVVTPWVYCHFTPSGEMKPASGSAFAVLRSFQYTRIGSQNSRSPST